MNSKLSEKSVNVSSNQHFNENLINFNKKQDKYQDKIKSQQSVTPYQLRQANLDLEKQVKILTANYEELLGQNKNQEVLIAQLKKQPQGDDIIKIYGNKINTLEEDVTFKNKYIEVLKTSIENKEKHIKELYDLNDKQKKTIEALQNEINTKFSTTLDVISLNKKIKDLLTSFELKSLENDRLELENKKLQDTMKKYEDKIRTLHQMIGANTSKKASFIPKKIYYKKKELKQQTINSMFNEQELSIENSTVEDSHLIPSFKRSLSLSCLSKSEYTSSTQDHQPLKKPTLEKNKKRENQNTNKQHECETVVLSYPEDDDHVYIKDEPIKSMNYSIFDAEISSPEPMLNNESAEISVATDANKLPNALPASSKHQHEKGKMKGDTCISCANFYGQETLTAVNMHGYQVNVSRDDRIQMNSRHRSQHCHRSRTPPGFWDLDFNSPPEKETVQIFHHV